MEYELLRILSILHPVKKPSEAKELLGKFCGTAIDEDSYESWRFAIQSSMGKNEEIVYAENDPDWMAHEGIVEFRDGSRGIIQRIK